MEQVHLREAVTDLDRETVFRLRYQIFITEEGLPATAQSAQSKMIEDAADREATLFLAETSEGEAVGTVGLTHGQVAADLLKARDPIPDHLLELINGRLGYAFWLGVKRSHAYRVFRFPEMAHVKRSTIGIALSIKAFRHCEAQGAEISFITTKPTFRRYFERMGFISYKKRIMHPYWHQPRSLMVLLMNDVDLFRLRDSPFLRYAVPNQGSPRLIRAFKESIETKEIKYKQAGGLS